MNFFRKKTTFTENIAFMALLCAIDVVFSVLATLVPLSDIVIVLFLPLVSAFAGCYCESKYLPIYIVSSIGVCLLASCYDLGAVLFYVIPAILSGSFYGFLVEKKIPVSLIVFLTALLEMGLNYASLPLIQMLYQVSMIDNAKTLLGLNDYVYVDDIVPTFIFGFSLAQAGLSHFFIQGILSDFKQEFAPEGVYQRVEPIIGILFGGLAVGLGFAYIPLAYVFLAFSLYFSALSIRNLIHPLPWWVFLVFGVMEGASIYAFALLSPFFPKDTSLLLSAFFFVSADTPSLLSSLLLSMKKQTSSKW